MYVSATRVCDRLLAQEHHIKAPFCCCCKARWKRVDFSNQAELEPLLASPNGTQSFGTTAAVAVATLSIDKKKGHTLCMRLVLCSGCSAEVVADIFREATQRRLPCIGNGLC